MKQIVSEDTFPLPVFKAIRMSPLLRDYECNYQLQRAVALAYFLGLADAQSENPVIKLKEQKHDE